MHTGLVCNVVNLCHHIFNMKLLIVLALVAAACAIPLPQPKPQDVQILRYDNDNSGLGQWSYALEQSDGTKRQEQGQLKNAGAENESISVTGSYSWLAPDGVLYTVTYIADENGFQPETQQGPGGGGPTSVLGYYLNKTS